MSNMQLSPPTELWRPGILHKPLAEAAFFTAEQWAESAITWLDHPRSFAYYADPFGLMRDGFLHLFVEGYDYREKHGHIVAFTLAPDGSLIPHGTVLREPWHLSYPFVFENENEIYMLPEAYRSGTLTLYRATRFPSGWEPAMTLLDLPAIDPTLCFHEGRFWLFFSLPEAPLTELHLAYAYRLEGPWHLHPENPVLEGIDRARPGGSPFIHNGALHLPMQDASRGYGSALNLLRISQLDTQGFAAEMAGRIKPGKWSTPYTAGVHNLSGDTQFTLIDAKRIWESPARHLINAERRLKKLF
jgi:hypothetical protein